MEFYELDEYTKDLKKISKRYKSLVADIDIVKKVLKVSPVARPPFSFAVNNLGITSCIIKVKKIACRSLKGKGVNTGLRLIYAHFDSEQTDEGEDPKKEERIVFIEIYHKSDKENENRERILKHFK